MKLRRSIALSVAAGAALLLAAPTTASATPSSSAPTGTRSLAAKPTSPVGVLTQGDVALTAFLPSDFAFRDLVRQLTGTTYASEKDVFAALVTAAGVDTVETVLLFHVVPGATITSKDAVNADGAKLATAQGGTITVDVIVKRLGVVKLVDQDPTDANPYLIPFALNINRGNKQIAHGITAVLRPVDLP